MSKIRISVLAKELGVKSNDLISLCQKKGFSKIHHHANTLEDDQVNLVKRYYENSGKQPKQDKPPVKVEEAVGGDGGKKDISVKSSVQYEKKDFSGGVKPSQPKRFVRLPQKEGTQFRSSGRQDSGRGEPKRFVKPPQKGGAPFPSSGRQEPGKVEPKKFVKPPQKGGTPFPSSGRQEPGKVEPKRFIRIQQTPGGPASPRFQSPGRQEPARNVPKGGKDKKSFTPDNKGGQKFPFKPRQRYGGYRGGNRQQFKSNKRTEPVVRVPKDRNVQVEVPVSVKELSNKLGVKANNIISKLLIDHDIRATVNQNLDRDVVELLGIDFDFEIEIKEAKTFENEIKDLESVGNPDDMVSRTPIVAFLGHVDHGKTSLLDSIRQTNVAVGEAGGITQHMGAYHVEAHGKRVIFLDTPGHEAFTAMRARGANVTDVVVLVVAADDGVMPQTIEALDHAKAANVPILVAVNKVDKPGANVLKVKQQLASLDLNPEEWGGNTQIVETSAITKQGLDELVEKLLLESEILDLKYNPKVAARGVVLEAQIHAGKGVMANIIVREGVLTKGDIVFCGHTYGKVRTMYTDRGLAVKKGGPETPLLISDFSDVPNAGDRFYVVSDIVKAKDIAFERQNNFRESDLAGRNHVTLDNLFSKIEEDNIKEIKVILKADFKGSVEVLKKTVEGLSIGEIKIRALHIGVGNITESDILLADASDAIVIGFCVDVDDKAKGLIEEKGVDLRLYKVIYNVIKDIKDAMEGMLEPEKRDQVLGHVEVQRVFKISRMGNIAGCLVRDGKVTRNSLIRLIRNDVVLHSGKLESLKTDKDAAKEVKAGYECGVKILGYDDIKTGDIIEAYEIQSIARSLPG